MILAIEQGVKPRRYTLDQHLNAPVSANTYMHEFYRIKVEELVSKIYQRQSHTPSNLALLYVRAKVGLLFCFVFLNALCAIFAVVTCLKNF